jgi:NAD(P)-dependent dehydrogenase (short-subunit alcohol dehydrogenase family)
MELKGKKILVTGGASGYGYGMAESLAAAGGKVWITGREEGNASARTTSANWSSRCC